LVSSGVQSWHFLSRGIPIQIKQLLLFCGTLSLLCPAAKLHAQEPSHKSASQQTPAQQKQAPKRVRISQGVSDGLIVNKVQPEYPSEARNKGVEGSVLMQVLISDTGNVTNLRVISGDGMLVPSAMAAVQQWKYRPYVLNGQPAEVETQVTIKYELRY
jgi:TonB family protein